MMAWHRVAAWTVVLVVAACGGKDASNDPSRPAVVKAPPVILPSDTAKPDTMAAHREKMAELSRQLGEPYAVITAGIVFGDRRLLTSYYAPTATLKLVDTTAVGITPIADALLALGRRTGLTEWQRQSRVLTGAADSIYVDSGYYLMRGQRPGGPKHEERGTYVARWRHLGGPTPWVLLYDEVTPDAPARKR